MVYNWDGKEAECYRLYVQEKRSLNEVMEYWEQRGFTPSKRAFQTQFKRWNFPGKQSPAYKNEPLIARVKALWESNTTQKDTLDMLQAEGFNINDRELVRLRSRFGWFLRESRGKKQDETDLASPIRKKRKAEAVPAGDGLIDQLAAAILQEAGTPSSSSDDEQNAEQQHENGPAPHSGPLDPVEALRRELRHQHLQAESDEKWRARKRRRRTRGWAGLPADAPGEPPRFPSETTLDESKAYLGLDNTLYAQIREQFQAICREQNIYKKTVAGPEKWAELLQRLVRKNHHLAAAFQEQAEVLREVGALWKPKNYKTLSLDVICQDVTKRLRVMETRMSIPEVKNALSLNPLQTREVKHSFYTILKEDHFTNKFEAGEQHWNELKQRWVNRSESLRQAITPGMQDAERAHRLRAIEVLARDVMKRMRAETTRREKEEGRHEQEVHQGPGPGPAKPMPHAPRNRIAQGSATGVGKSESGNVNVSSDSQLQDTRQCTAVADEEDLQIDPSLLLAASDAATLPTPVPSSQQYLDPPSSFHNDLVRQTFPAPLPIYFRLHPRSTTPFPHKTVWLSILQSSRSLEDVRRLAAREHPGTVVLGLEGVVATRRAEGDGEIRVGVGDNAELGAYLGHVGAGNGKVVFVVCLGMAGGGERGVCVSGAELERRVGFGIRRV